MFVQWNPSRQNIFASNTGPISGRTISHKQTKILQVVGEPKRIQVAVGSSLLNGVGSLSNFVSENVPMHRSIYSWVNHEISLFFQWGKVNLQIIYIIFSSRPVSPKDFLPCRDYLLFVVLCKQATSTLIF